MVCCAVTPSTIKGKNIFICLLLRIGLLPIIAKEIFLATLYIDAIEDSTITVTEKDFTKLTSDRKSLIKRINVLQKRVIMLMSSSAVERYQHFVETYPDIIQRVPQRMIASYLGITPEALSRLRKEISKNK